MYTGACRAFTTYITYFSPSHPDFTEQVQTSENRAAPSQVRPGACRAHVDFDGQEAGSARCALVDRHELTYQVTTFRKQNDLLVVKSIS